MQNRPIIIGSGHNGLVTAFYLARAGLRPLVLERRAVVGGVATTEEIAPGISGPALAHTLGPLRPSVVRDMRLIERGVKFTQPDPAVVALAPEGGGVAFHSDSALTQRSIAAISRHDAERYPEFAAVLQRLAPVLREALEMTPPDVDHPDRQDLWKLLTAGRRFRALSKPDAFRLVRWMPMAVADLVAEYFESDLVQATIAARALFGTNLGPWSAGTGALLLLYAAADPMPAGSSATAAGGVGAVTKAMAQAAADAGAEIRTGAAVERIEVGTNGVQAVRLQSGETIEATTVVSNADPRRTFLGLVDPMVLEPSFVHRITNYRARGTTAKLNLVLGRSPLTAAAQQMGVGPGTRIHIGPTIDYLERAFDASKYGRCSDAPWLEVILLPAGEARGDAHVLSVMAHFAPYRLRDATWTAHGEVFADAIVRTLDAYFPGVSGSITARQMLTPVDIEERFGLTGGHIHHGEPGLDQLFVMRPVMGWARYRTPVNGLYLCGGGTHPGPGLTGGSGQNAAREILKDLKK